MKTYNIFNEQHQVVKTMRTKNLLEVEDAVFNLIYDSRDTKHYYFEEKSENGLKTPSDILMKWTDIHKELQGKINYASRQKSKASKSNELAKYQDACSKLKTLTDYTNIIDDFIFDLKQLTTPGLHR